MKSIAKAQHLPVERKPPAQALAATRAAGVSVLQQIDPFAGRACFICRAPGYCAHRELAIMQATAEAWRLLSEKKGNYIHGYIRLGQETGAESREKGEGLT